MQNRRPERDRLRLPCRTANPSCPSRPNPRPIRSGISGTFLVGISGTSTSSPSAPSEEPPCASGPARAPPFAPSPAADTLPDGMSPLRPSSAKVTVGTIVKRKRRQRNRGSIFLFAECPSRFMLHSFCCVYASLPKWYHTWRFAPASRRAGDKKARCSPGPLAPNSRLLTTRIIESSRQKEAAASRRRRDWWPVPSAKLRSRLPRRCTSRQK